MLDQQQDVGSARLDAYSGRALYRRTMPGGGYVEVELMGASEDASPRGRIIMERRSKSSRRVGNSPPVVVELVGADEDALLSDLVRLARDNAELARRLLRWQVTGSRAD